MVLHTTEKLYNKNIFSFIVLGYFRNSDKSLLISEFISSVGEIIRFVNDRAFEQVGRLVGEIDRQKVENLLAFLEAAEIFLEIGAGFVGGEVARWVVISIVQSLKYICFSI
jgi:hypothetical protein